LAVFFSTIYLYFDEGNGFDSKAFLQQFSKLSSFTFDEEESGFLFIFREDRDEYRSAS